MKKIALSVAALAISTGSALAADLPSRKAAPVLPPPPPPAPMWTGFYVGLNAGGTWANSNQLAVGVLPISSDRNFPFGAPGDADAYLQAYSLAASGVGSGGGNGGFIGGGQIGYNWQFFGNFVAGVEADIQGVAGAGSSGARIVNTSTGLLRDPIIGVSSVRGNLDYLGTVRGRLGWLFTPTLLLYGTGGLAYGGVTLNSTTAVYNDLFGNFGPAIGGVNYSNTQVGWTAGGGVEWMFMPNWSAKVEYLYYDLGSVTQGFALPLTNTAQTTDPNALFGGQVRARFNGNIVRAGLNYHFNWGSPAPVLAKY